MPSWHLFNCPLFCTIQKIKNQRLLFYYLALLLKKEILKSFFRLEVRKQIAIRIFKIG